MLNEEKLPLEGEENITPDLDIPQESFQPESVIFLDYQEDFAQEPAEIADAIAQAVASSLEKEDRIDAIAGVPTVDLDQMLQEAERPVAAQELTPEPQEETPREAGESQKTGETETAGETGDALEEPDATLKSDGQEPNAPELSSEETDSREPEPETPEAPVPNRAPQTRIPRHTRLRSKRRRETGTPQYARMIAAEIRARQNQALPPAGVSLRKEEKRLSILENIDRVLMPLRYVLLVLMILALGGRKYSWMLLGILGGEQGIRVLCGLTALSALLAWGAVYRGFRDMFYLRFSQESLLIFTTVLTMAEALLHKNQNTMLPLLAMAWCFSGNGTQMIRKGNHRLIRTVITGRGRQGIRMVPGLFEDTDCIGRAPASTAGFIRSMAKPDVWHRVNTMAAFPLLIITLFAAAFLSARSGGSFLTILVTLLCTATPVSMTISSSRAYEMMTRATTGRGAVAGWGGMQRLFGKKLLMIYDNDLFPKGTIGHKGIKAYGKNTARTLISYGASLVLRANINLGDTFARLLREMDGELLEVQGFQVLRDGLRGRIHGIETMVGSYHFMQLMGVELPPKAPVNGVYISINREMSGVVSISYKIQAGAKSGFRRLVREPRLTPLIVTRNFSVNPAFVEKHFGAPVSALQCPKADTRRKLSEPSVLRRGICCGFMVREGVAAYSRVVAGARSVYRTALILAVFSTILSVVLMGRAILAIYAGTALITASRLLIMHLIFWLVVEIAARIAVRS